MAAKIRTDREDVVSEAILRLQRGFSRSRARRQWLWVAAVCNLVDGPGRDDVSKLEEMSTAEVEVVWPSQMGW